MIKKEFKIVKKKTFTPEQTEKKKRKKRIRHIVDIIFFSLWICWIFVPPMISSLKIKDFDKYVQKVEMVGSIDADIIALGEGTHGTKEFHELKLEVFKELVAEGFRAFVIEGTFGDGEVINDYIQGGETSLDKAYAETSYRCYKTDDTKALLAWMREYNDHTVNDSEKLRFYGCDIQHYDNSSKHILAYLREAGCADVEQYASWLMEFDRADSYYSEDEKDQLLSNMNELENLIKTTQDESSVEYRYAVEDCEVIKMGILLNTSSEAYTRDRDFYMAETLKWIINEEKTNYNNSKIMVSAHNGHVAKGQTANYKTLGMYMSEELGDRYHAIGTDFYKGSVNMPKLGERTTQSWNTADPLAAQMKHIDIDKAYIDFARVSKDDKLSKIINRKMLMGSLGEGYSFIMHVLPNTYRIYKVPTEFYDGMILVYESTPTTIVWNN